jgi:hypothetical protein
MSGIRMSVEYLVLAVAYLAGTTLLRGQKPVLVGVLLHELAGEGLLHLLDDVALLLRGGQYVARLQEKLHFIPVQVAIAVSIDLREQTSDILSAY